MLETKSGDAPNELNDVGGVAVKSMDKLLSASDISTLENWDAYIRNLISMKSPILQGY